MRKTVILPALIAGLMASQLATPAAAACKAGGVGKYSGSQFVHMDCGPVRVWGR